MSRRSPTRRDFLLRAASFAVGALPFSLSRARPAARAQKPVLATDETIILKWLGRGVDENLSRLPVGELVAKTARGFLGRPYEANTLEEQGDEHLVVNLREFDCVTLCETSLAMARSLKLHEGSVEGYCAQLRRIRYRFGVIDGYPSRLHYFSDWIADNEQKKILRDVTKDLGGRRDGRTLNFMSSHVESYPRLASARDVAAIDSAEKRLSGTPRYFLPKEKVKDVLGRIEDGDIIAVTTSIAGLDVSHTGIAVREGGTTRLLHAPNVGHQVQISSGSLSEYLSAHGTQTGIMVARPLDPQA
jgi:hypothetical protein